LKLENNSETAMHPNNFNQIKDYWETTIYYAQQFQWTLSTSINLYQSYFYDNSRLFSIENLNANQLIIIRNKVTGNNKKSFEKWYLYCILILFLMLESQSHERCGFRNELFILCAHGVKQWLPFCIATYA
jgi:hypothetical protein